MPKVISPNESRAMVAAFAHLPFTPFEFHGFLGKRRTVSFGFKYDFAGQTLRPAEEMPAFILELRGKAAEFSGIAPQDFVHAMITEYEPGAAIGWHKDRAEFGKVVGLSFASAARFRFRKQGGAGWERITHWVEPGSAYLLDGPARSQWEHSIPAVEALRYSVTFRTLR